MTVATSDTLDDGVLLFFFDDIFPVLAYGLLTTFMPNLLYVRPSKRSLLIGVFRVFYCFEQSSDSIV